MPGPTTDQLLETATARHRAGNLAEARRLYRIVLAEAPTHTVAMFRGGLLELQDGHPDAALALIAQAVAAAPDEPRHQFGLGQVFQALHRYDEAAAAYRRVLRADPDSADAPFALGTCLTLCGRLPQAAAAYGRALDLRPDDVGAMSNLAIVLQDIGRVDEAVKLLCSCVDVQPGV